MDRADNLGGLELALNIGLRRMRRAVRAAQLAGRPVPSVIIVGGGMSGLGTGIQLRRAGVTGFTIIEQSDGVGGTWRDNTYPGSGCDVPSHLYSFSFASKTDWTRRFAEQPEILDYAEHLVDRYGLADHLRLGTTVDDAVFDEGSGRWRVSVTPIGGGSEVLEADAVIFACGQLNRPSIPDLPGLDRFTGPSWHSARWDHQVDLEGKQVAVVGSGASAIQFVPPVAARAGRLTIYQRSTNYVVPKPDKVYGPLQRWLLDHVRAYELAYRWRIYWSLETKWFAFRKDSWAGKFFRKLITKGIESQVVSDRMPAQSVVPDYPVGCKRLLISNDWYPAILRPTVELVNEPIERVEADAVVTTDGTRRPADVLIFGTGFHTTDFLSAIPITGRDGRTLASAWEDGVRAYFGISVAGFPNCFLLYGPNTNLGHNSILFMVERQLNVVLQALAADTEARTAGVPATVEVTAGAYDREDARVQRLMSGTTWVNSCRSWYKTASGRVTNNWPTWTVRYWLDTLWLRPDDLRVTALPVGAPATTADPGRTNGSTPSPAPSPTQTPA
ncbi:MAG TPA: NAD(P)/FAD-dependent oxidoreductase, partial [Acidimicrobiales bacterium]|nr:NAD(P)/FAD-dependent oxidoreductase [Acidimicrobiales bacterium]